MDEFWDTMPEELKKHFEEMDEESRKMFMEFSSEMRTISEHRDRELEALTPKEYGSLPDGALLDATISIIFRKCPRDMGVYDYIASLPKEISGFYAGFWVAEEVLEGGFNQLFYNDPIDLIKRAVSYYSEIGAMEMQKILLQALQIYAESGDFLEKYHDGDIENFSASYEEDPWEELVQPFADAAYEIDNFEERETQHIRKHIEIFSTLI